MALNLALFYAEQLPPIVREELEQLIASLATQLGDTSVPTNTRQIVQLIQVEYTAGATTASASIPTPVILGEAKFTILGDSVENGSGGTSTQANQSILYSSQITGSQVSIFRKSGQNSAGNDVTGVVTVQVEWTRTTSI